MKDTELQSTLETYLEKRLGHKVLISRMKSLTGGACQENFSAVLDWHLSDGTTQHRDVVYRTDKGGSLMNSLPRELEFQVCRLAFEAGVKTPEPFWLETDRQWTGNPFYFLQKIGGTANGRFVVKDSSLGTARKSLAGELALNLAKIHSVRPNAVKDNHLNQALWQTLPSSEDLSDTLSVTSKNPNSVAERAVLTLRHELNKREEVYPAMELILNWLEAESKPTEQIVLVHGDFRTGNFMVSPNGLEGIVDWEFAHWGDPHEDLTWICLKDWRFGKNNKEVGGFADRSEFYEAYQKASGIVVDSHKVRYWEVMGNLRWAIGCLGQAERHLSGKDKGIELASIGRRASEMEREALRIIEETL